MTGVEDKAEVLREIGAMLRKSRMDDGASLRGLSAKTGVSVAYLCDVEFGRRSFSPARLREIAEAVGMTEAQRTKLFVTAGMVPPMVRDRVAKAPKTWGYDPQRLLHLALELKKSITGNADVCAALGGDVLNALTRALQKVDW